LVVFWRALVAVSVRQGKTETGFIDHEEHEGRKDGVIALNKSGDGGFVNLATELTEDTEFLTG